MNQVHSQKIDLSSLPPEIRQRVEAAMARLTPEQRKQWEQTGSRMLGKLIASLGGQGGSAPPPLPHQATAPRPGSPAPRPTATGGQERIAAGSQVIAPRSAPQGHYNDTIQPGDRGGRAWWISLVLLLAAAGVYALR